MRVLFLTLSLDAILHYQMSRLLEKNFVYYTITRSQKAHGCDDLSINKIKICDIEIVKPLYLIYMKCVETGRFPFSWKKANVLPIHKKRKQVAKEKLQTYFTFTYLRENI